MATVQELVSRINALDTEFASTCKQVDEVLQRKEEVAAEARECYAALYDILSQGENSYFRVGDSVVIVNRNFNRDSPNSLKIQPLVNI